MTARAGDALSHVNFRPLPGPIFRRLLIANQPPQLGDPDRCGPGELAAKLIGSTRICMATMSRRNRPGSLHPSLYLRKPWAQRRRALFYNNNKY
jgi:hypothetical protein